jgi:hypothetical protein
MNEINLSDLAVFRPMMQFKQIEAELKCRLLCEIIPIPDNKSAVYCDRLGESAHGPALKANILR